MYKYSLIPASKQDELLMSWSFSMSFKRIQDVPSWMSWVYRILQSSLFSSLLPWRQKNMWSCSSASVMFCVCVGVSVQKKGKVKCTSTTCRWTHSKQSGLVQCELLQKCVCVGCVGHLFVFCPSSIEKKHLWIAMWCFRPLKFFIFPNLWPPNSIWDMSNKKKSWSYLDLLTRNDACLEKVTQVHILPTWWWKIMMIYLGRIRKKVNKQTNPKLHSTTRFQPWSWCEPSASLQWFGWNIPLM